MAYNNEANLYDALTNIVNNMHRYIKQIGGKYIIENPVMSEENFAEKWNEVPEKADEFFQWLQAARKTILIDPLNVQGIHKLSESLEGVFGGNIVKKAFTDEGNFMKMARDNKSLYIEGLTGGLKTSPSATSSS